MRSCRSLFLIVLMLSVTGSYGTTYGQNLKQEPPKDPYGITHAKGKKQFTYTGSPAFVIEYPDNCGNDILLPDQVLRVQAPAGSLSFEISVLDVPKEGAKLEDQGKNYVKAIESFGTDFKILSQKPAKLKDGTPAQETSIEWKFQGSMPVLSLVVVVMKDNKVVSLGGHVIDGNLTPIGEILQTWVFK